MTIEFHRSSAAPSVAHFNPDLGQAPEVRFEHITTVHDGYHALDDVTATVPAGRITVFMGEPGSGKSVIVHHLLAEQGTTQGRVLINGTALEDATADQRRRFHRRVGILEGGDALRESEITDNASVVDNLVARLREADRVDDPQEAERLGRECLEQFDLAHVADQRSGRLEASDKRCPRTTWRAQAGTT